MEKIKVVSVFGTRPEAIKMAPVVLELEKREEFESITIVTAQHREMLDQILEYFKIVPDYDLNIMSKNQTLADITTHILNKLDPLLKEIRPDILLVHGDTSTTFVAALAAYYNQIPIGHVEAGLRTWNKYSPFPEEMNRQLTSDLADFHFAPTELAATNLLKEDKRKDSIFVTGNTVVDTLNMTVSDRKKRFNKKVLLLTLHRRENIENNVEEIFEAILDILEKNCDVTVIYPMHLNPRIRKKAYKYLGKHPNIKLIEPLDVFEFHNLIAESYLILTDSGGVQEEAPYFGVPVLVLRDTTERPEGIESGVAKLVGTRKNDIINVTNKLLTDKGLYLSMSNSKSPYGDGHATQKILKVIKESYTK